MLLKEGIEYGKRFNSSGNLDKKSEKGYDTLRINPSDATNRGGSLTMRACVWLRCHVGGYGKPRSDALKGGEDVELVTEAKRVKISGAEYWDLFFADITPTKMEAGLPASTLA